MAPVVTYHRSAAIGTYPRWEPYIEKLLAFYHAFKEETGKVSKIKGTFIKEISRILADTTEAYPHWEAYIEKLFAFYYVLKEETGEVSEIKNTLVEYLRTLAGTTIVSKIEDTFSELKRLGVKIPSLARVRNYLLNYSDITDILHSVCQSIREYFGCEAEISLEVYEDPEIEDEYLTLYIRAQEYSDSIINKIRDLRKEFGEQLSRTDGWILITTDFKKPQHAVRLERIP